MSASRRGPSLRRRMAVLGFAAVFVPVVLVLALVLVTTDEQVTGAPGGAAEVVVEVRPSLLVPLLAIVVAVPLGIAVSAWSKRLLRPLVQVTDSIERVEAGSLDRRVAMRDGPTEVRALADAFDRMLDRLATASQQQRRLIEDTAHQLRTPVTTATLAIDAMSRRGSVDSADDVDLERARRAVERLSVTVEDLLVDARDRQRAVGQIDTDLAALARRAVDEHDGDGTVRLTSPARCLAALDGPAVGRALANLIDNASRASPPGGVVDVIVGTSDGRSFLAVEDDGPGIAADDRPQLFERYWREGTGDGHGIGLAIVAQVAADHDGVDVESPAGNRSTRFTLWFR